MATFTQNKPRILVNSGMWQSPKWNEATTNVLAPNEILKSAENGWTWSLQVAWRLYRHRRSFDLVCTIGSRVALAYGLLSRLTWRGNPVHVVREIFLEELDAKSWQWKFKRRLIQFAFTNAAGIIVYSRGEQRLYAQHLGLPHERFYFVPAHTNIVDPHHERASRYGFAAGRSHRDYRTLFEAVRGLDYQFVVVSNKAGVSGLKIPENVEVHCDVPRETYLALLREAAFVVVPLRDIPRSTGQVVILEAYALGKPVVATRTIGTVDYVDPDRTGFLCDPNNATQMRAQISSLIKEPSKIQRMGQAALERVFTLYTFDKHVDELLELLWKISAERRA